MDFSGEVVRQFDAERPAALDLVLANESDREQTFELGGTPPFSRLGARDAPERGSLTLVPDGRSPEQATETPARFADAIPNAPDSDGCWRVTDFVVVPAISRRYSLAPGETFRGGYAVLAGREGDACLPSGAYEFEETVTVESAGTSRRDVSLQFVVTIR